MLVLLACAEAPLGEGEEKSRNTEWGYDTGWDVTTSTTGDEPQLDPGSWGVQYRTSRSTTTIGAVAVAAASDSASNRRYYEDWAMCSPSRFGSTSTSLRLRVATDSYTEATIEAEAAAGCGSATQYATRMTVDYAAATGRSAVSSSWTYGSSGYTVYTRDLKVSTNGGTAATVGHLVRLEYSAYRYQDVWYFHSAYPFPWSTDQAANQLQVELGAASVTVSAATVAAGPRAVLDSLYGGRRNTGDQYAVVSYQFTATSNAIQNTF